MANSTRPNGRGRTRASAGMNDGFVDDLEETPAERSRRRKRRRPRKVDYSELLIPPPPTDQRCPHTTRVVDVSSCSQCLGARAKRVRPASVIPPEDDE